MKILAMAVAIVTGIMEIDPNATTYPTIVA